MSEDKAKQNSAARLYDILVTLRTEAGKPPDGGTQQVLPTVLGVSRPADVYERLADLIRLPRIAADELRRANIPESFLGWVDPVERALGTLSGHVSAGLNAFSRRDINDAIVALKMCREVRVEDSFEMEDLGGVLEAVNMAIEELSHADLADRADLAEELVQWVLDNLRTIQDVLLTAKVLGLKAARRRMYELIGRLAGPRPEPKTSEEKGLVERLRSLLGETAKVVFVGDKMIEAAKTIGLLTE